MSVASWPTTQGRLKDAPKVPPPTPAHQPPPPLLEHAIANEGLRAVEAELTTMAWARNQQILLQLDQPHSTGMHCEIVDNHGEPLLMSNQELSSVMVQINWTLKTQALSNMQVQWRPKSAGKWHPF